MCWGAKRLKRQTPEHLLVSVAPLEHLILSTVGPLTLLNRDISSLQPRVVVILIRPSWIGACSRSGKPLASGALGGTPRTAEVPPWTSASKYDRRVNSAA